MKLDILFPTPNEIIGWREGDGRKPPPSYFTKESSWLNLLFQIRFLILSRCDRVNSISVLIEDKKTAISITFELEKLGYGVDLKKQSTNRYHLKVSWEVDEESLDDLDEQEVL